MEDRQRPRHAQGYSHELYQRGKHLFKPLLDAIPFKRILGTLQALRSGTPLRAGHEGSDLRTYPNIPWQGMVGYSF
jgi:hypothetical protein